MGGSNFNGGGVMDTFVIEKHIPIPARKWTGAGRNSKYPFRQMETGDSFYVLGDEHVKVAVKSAATHHARKHGGRFTARADEHGVRIWRVE